MRIMLIVAWLFTGLGGVIYHYGPGQEKLEIDRVSSLLNQARMSVDKQDWSTAVDTFDQVLSDLPAEKVNEAQAVVLEKAKAQMMAAQLPKARSALEELLTDLRADENADPKFVADVQSTLANSQYCKTARSQLVVVFAFGTDLATRSEGLCVGPPRIPTFASEPGLKRQTSGDATEMEANIVSMR